MHYSVGWHINSVCCTHHFVGWYITLSSGYSTLPVVCTTLVVGILLCQLHALSYSVGLTFYSVGWTHYSVGWTHYSVCCTHYSVGSKHLPSRLYALLCQLSTCTLSVVCTTLSVVNIYSVSCTYYSWLVHYSFCCTHQSVGWYITLSVAELLFWLDPLLCCTHYRLLALFADNAKGFCIIRSVSECESLQSDIDNLVEWSDEWNPVFDTDECSLCSVTRKHEPVTYDYTMGTKTLIRVDNQSDLGVLITCDSGFD